MTNRVSDFAVRHTLWQPGMRFVIALSGGSDSVALLRVLCDLQAGGAVRIEAAAHFHHGIRGADADADEEFCRALCAAQGVPLVVGRGDVPALARRDRQSIEVAARHARRTFLMSVLASRRADRLATAHTRDDQAETVLLRLMRGAGLRGVAAIAPRRGSIVRPLLACSRAELRQYLVERGQSWREDATNADLSLPRNRMRHDILPQLEAHFNPRAREALARFADIARDDEEQLAREAVACAVHVVSREADILRIDRSAFLRLSVALSRRVARLALESAGRTQPTSRDVEALLDVVTGRVSSVDVPGLRMEPSGGFVVLMNKGSRRTVPSFSFDLLVPGTVRWPNGGWVLTAEGPAPADERAETAGSSRRVAVDAARLGSVLVVRSRQPGDWLRPLGVGGRKKVQDLLVDRKVRAETRDNVPIVTTRDGRIVWVAGQALDADFRPSSDTNTVVILELRRIRPLSGEGAASSEV